MVQEMMSSTATLSFLTEIATDNQPAVNTHSIYDTEVQSPIRSRPRREIKRPKYLDDYVLQLCTIFF